MDRGTCLLKGLSEEAGQAGTEGIRGSDVGDQSASEESGLTLLGEVEQLVRDNDLPRMEMLPKGAAGTYCNHLLDAQTLEAKMFAR